MKSYLSTIQKKLMPALLFIILFCSCQKQEDKAENSNGLTTKSANQFRTNETELVACTGSGINHFISLDEAIIMIDRYQIAVKNKNVATIFNSSAWVNAETYSGDAVQKILDQPGCCRFRIYNGIGKDNMQHMIMVGTNSAGEDILYTSKRGAQTANTNTTDPPPPLIVNVGAPCPSICGGTYITP